MRIRYRSLAALAGMLILLAACARPANEVLPTATPILCDVRVDGRWVVGPAGKPLILYGASLPTLTEMEKSSYPVADRLHDLSAAGASLVRLAVDFHEESPTFVPAKVVPFVQQANHLGMVVVLSWNTILSGTANLESDPLNDTVDDAEDWLRQEITYLSNNPGAWFELYGGAQNVSSVRQRNITRRLIDVARGYRANNIIVVNDPVWMLEPDSSNNQPLSATNVVYGLDARAGAAAGLDQAQPGSGFDVNKYPFIVNRWEGNPGDLARLGELKIGATAMNLANPIPAALAQFWKANPAEWGACHKQ